MNIFLIVLTIFNAGCKYQSNNFNPPQVNREEPLIITDYLNNGQSDLAKQLSKLDLWDIESYAGFFRVSDDCVRNMYFWYFPAENGNTSAPLLVWLQGGPGASSLYALFVENGPYFVDPNDNLQLRKISWTNEFNVIFIDNPVGTGFSFSEPECFLTDEEHVGFYLSKVMEQFYQFFPELKPNDLYITGESYAGKYAPIMVYAIHQHNQNNPTPMNLKGMAVGDGLCDPYNMLNYGNYFYYTGNIFDNQVEIFDNLFSLIRENIEAGKFYEASEYKDQIFKNYRKLTGLTDIYNYYVDREEPFENYADFLNENSQNLNAGNTTFYDSRDVVYMALYADRAMSMSPVIEKVINYGYKVLFFSGQLDIIDPFPSTTAFLRELEWNGKEDFDSAPQQIWYSKSDSTKVNGYYKYAGNFMQLIVRNAGHMVPMDQPQAAVEMLKLFIYDF